MTNLKFKLTTGLVTGAFLAGVVLPAGAFAATNVTVTGNGYKSSNKVIVKNTKKTKLSQTNSAVVSNSVGISQSTGGNNANGNTGGNVTVTSGDASATVGVTNTIGGNSLVWDNCGCVDPNTTVDISGNGSKSTSTVKVYNYDSTKVTQSNTSVISNSVNVSQSTGGNNANNNTNGTVDVTSGDATANVTITNTTGDNTLGSI